MLKVLTRCRRSNFLCKLFSSRLFLSWYKSDLEIFKGKKSSWMAHPRHFTVRSFELMHKVLRKLKMSWHASLIMQSTFFLSICLKNGAAFLGRHLLTKMVYVSQKIHICLKTMEKTCQIVFSYSGVSIELWVGCVFICRTSILYSFFLTVSRNIQWKYWPRCRLSPEKRSISPILTSDFDIEIWHVFLSVFTLVTPNFFWGA